MSILMQPQMISDNDVILKSTGTKTEPCMTILRGLINSPYSLGPPADGR